LDKLVTDNLLFSPVTYKSDTIIKVSLLPNGSIVFLGYLAVIYIYLE
jgi:hypothetical protein